MKHLYTILFIIPLIFTSCTKEEEIQPTILRTDLYGNWISSDNTNNYSMTLSSNGRFIYIIDSQDGSDQLTNSGDWWVEDENLALSGYSWSVTGYFNVSDNTLSYNDLIWDK